MKLSKKPRQPRQKLSPFAGGKAPGAPMEDKEKAKRGMPTFSHGGPVKKKKMPGY